MTLSESVKKWLEKSKKTLKNSALALALAWVLTGCDSDNNTMTFDKDDQSGKMSIAYLGSEPVYFDIKIRELSPWNYQGEIDEEWRGFCKEYTGNLDSVIAEMTHDIQGQAQVAMLSSVESIEKLEDLAWKKMAFFKEEYQKFLKNKQVASKEIKYIPDQK